MNTKTSKIILSFLGMGLLLFTGCSRRHPAPPLERSELVSRFFQSIENGNSASATSQGQKLLAMDTENGYVASLINIQQSNSYVEQAQKLVNQGNIDQALKVIEAGIKEYPKNQTMQQLHGRLRQLRNAKKLIANLHEAKTSAEISTALTAAIAGLSSNHTPKLDEYFKVCRQRISEANEQEMKATRLEAKLVSDMATPANKNSTTPAKTFPTSTVTSFTPDPVTVSDTASEAKESNPKVQPARDNAPSTGTLPRLSVPEPEVPLPARRAPTQVAPAGSTDPTPAPYPKFNFSTESSIPTSRTIRPSRSYDTRTGFKGY